MFNLRRPWAYGEGPMNKTSLPFCAENITQHILEVQSRTRISLSFLFFFHFHFQNEPSCQHRGWGNDRLASPGSRHWGTRASRRWAAPAAPSCSWPCWAVVLGRCQQRAAVAAELPEACKGWGSSTAPHRVFWGERMYQFKIWAAIMLGSEIKKILWSSPLSFIFSVFFF